ncbi:serine hydrolase [Altererythrobacter sp. KTW20L]|uniref:serine hydrolase n=1 Tax=Altererythrobacter sp. KTW20L TaxID=2942210 RepID=UPI0020BE5330|nr:serine hydrolase [Altererythrobacter sp. KTW20L]MCL6251029.1 serine hydrolase [Altererythrobacter sp. KTW20L]
MIRLFLALFALLTLTSPAVAQDLAVLEQRAEDVASVFHGEAAYTDVFTPEFVAAVSQQQFEALKEQLAVQMGPFVGLEGVEPGSAPGSGQISLRFERALVGGPMQLEDTAPYRVAGLLLNDIAPVNDEGLSLEERLQALPGETSILFARLEGSEVLASHNAARQFAIGSTFKLYVLSALSQSIARGERQWSDVVALTERSFPSGQLQDWPQGSPLTLHTLAAAMISISDNTSTDQLIALLGRDAVEAELRASGHSDPAATLPFLTTRELFLLKLGADEGLEAYRAASAEQRRAMLAALQDSDLDMADVQRVFAGGPRFIDIEWFASAEDIARVYARLAEDQVAREILAINLGMDRARFDAWDYAGYKGGSEPGVLNFSWFLRDGTGDYWVLAMSWNDAAAAVSEMQFLGLAQAALTETRAR